MISKDEAQKEIEKLIEKFDENKEFYLSSEYNEMQTRREFIEPFFKALGWDMDNEKREPEPYKDVIYEDKIYDEKGVKAPDYCFTIYGHKKFFVEAKKPSIDIKEQISPIYQVRRYGWSAGLPVCVLTDFEEFSIYQCTKKPTLKDKPIDERIRYFVYKQYVEEFDYIWEYFSRESVHRGSLEKLAKSDAAKRGTEAVNKEFLKSLEDWRKLLAVNIALRNSNLNEDEINYAVQQTIDRMIFLRICEDRKVEQYGKLKNIIDSKNPLRDFANTFAPFARNNLNAKDMQSDAKDNLSSFYQYLLKYFKEADEKYNSGIFDFSKDKITPKIIIDDKVIKKIINELYYPDCPYEFSVLPIEILGNAYEQFLGKVIRLTAGHQAKVEEKPEVRKAGGVYYTPQYIVDYIVKNTVGKLIEGKSPNEIEKIKICDPACGSGSFLIGAYRYLLDYHLNYHLKKYFTAKDAKFSAKEREGENSLRTFASPLRSFAVKKIKYVPITPEGTLTTAEKKRILLNNIFGVDIDPQAVEVTKLSLLLKAMEGETDSSIKTQLTLFNERVLPTLENNIKCGNSLIGPDFYDGLFAGSADVLIRKDASQETRVPGEYLKIRPFDWKEEFKEVFKQGGFDCIIGNPPYVRIHDINLVERDYFKKVFQTATNQYDLYQLFYEKGLKLLKEFGLLGFITSNKFCITNYGYSLRKYIIENFSIEQIVDVSDLSVFKEASTYPYIFIIQNTRNIQSFIEIFSSSIENSFIFNAKILQENLRSNNEFYITLTTTETEDHLLSKINQNSLNSALIVYRGRGTTKDIFTKQEINFIPAITNKQISRYSLSKEIYFKNKKKYATDFEPKLLMKKICFNLEVAFDEKGDINPINTVYVIKSAYSQYNLKYILGLLNSRLFSFFARNKFKATHMGGGYIELRVFEVEQLPINKIDFSNPSEKSLHDEIVKYVDTMLALNKEINKTKLPDRRNQIESRIKYTDKKIDALVYKLYGLTEDEIKIIEGA